MATKCSRRNRRNVVISPPVEAGGSSPPVEGSFIGQRMHTLGLAVGQSGASRKSVHEGVLMKRCRVSISNQQYLLAIDVALTG